MKEKPAPSKTIEQHLSIDQVAAKLCVHRSTVQRLLYEGMLGYRQVGRRRIISESHLRKYLALIEREATVHRMY
jgi:excisionase family DNA binding protein